MFWMPGKSYRGPLPPLTESQQELADTLRSDVAVLAETIGERNVSTPHSLQRAANHLKARLTNIGYELARQPHEAAGHRVENLSVELPGTTLADEIVVVAAHCDSVAGSPGANDNASGVACLLALAAALHPDPQPRTIRFVAFVNEEPPFFKSDQMGSHVYAKACRKRQDNIVAMLALDGIGFYRDDAGSQHYPGPFGLLYPSRGNFVAFVSRSTDGDLVRRSIRAFRAHAQFPSEGAAPPGFLPGVDWSDHWSFWQFGYGALLVTDTLPFRYPHYPQRTDTPDHLDYDRMSRVAEGLQMVVRSLAEGG